jgi:general stress protein 26
MRREDDKSHLSGDAAVRKIRELLPNFRSAMMVTRDSELLLHARPLALIGDPKSFEGVLWFFVDERSHKVDEASNGSSVSLLFQNDERSAYLHLVGSGSTTRDLEKMKELYSPVVRTWFPDGLDDPNLTLLKFEASSGAYWDNRGGVLAVLFGLATAVVTGHTAEVGHAGELSIP